MPDPKFEKLVEMARATIENASDNFGADDFESDGFRAFAYACLGEAARRYVAMGNAEAREHLETLLELWRSFEPGGHDPPQAPFQVIKGGKD